MPNDERTIVVVGGVAGGASAAARARRCNEHAKIRIFVKDHYVSFANCGLPFYLGGEIQEREKLLVATEERFRKRFNVEVRTRHEVVAIHFETKNVVVLDRENGQTFDQPYDKLILATGARASVPPISGTEGDNVFRLYNLEDADRIKAWLDERQPRRAVVVGAGFIGLEMIDDDGGCFHAAFLRHVHEVE